MEQLWWVVVPYAIVCALVALAFVAVLAYLAAWRLAPLARRAVTAILPDELMGW